METGSKTQKSTTKNKKITKRPTVYRHLLLLALLRLKKKM